MQIRGLDERLEGAKNEKARKQLGTKSSHHSRLIRFQILRRLLREASSFPLQSCLKKNPDSFLLITSGTTVDRQTERTPEILIKRNPNPQPVVELNPVSDSRFN